MPSERRAHSLRRTDANLFRNTIGAIWSLLRDPAFARTGVIQGEQGVAHVCCARRSLGSPGSVARVGPAGELAPTHPRRPRRDSPAVGIRCLRSVPSSCPRPTRRRSDKFIVAHDSPVVAVTPDGPRPGWVPTCVSLLRLRAGTEAPIRCRRAFLRGRERSLRRGRDSSRTRPARPPTSTQPARVEVGRSWLYLEPRCSPENAPGGVDDRDASV